MIGLLTFQDTNNFGACLQAVALYSHIKKLGHDIEIINYHNETIYNNEVLSLRPRFSLKGIATWILRDRKFKKRYKILRKEFNSKVKLSERKYTKSDIANCNNKYQTLLIGSDQVWCLTLTGYDYSYFLDFADKNKHKISFSSSISNEIAFKNDKHAQNLISKFDHVSVREKSAKKLILELTGQSADWVCDPTMLYDAEGWDNLLDVKNHIKNSEDYVFIYFVDPNKKIYKDALAFAKQNNCKVLYCGITPFRRGIKSIIPSTMSEWVSLIKNAKALFTSSYHGLLFGLYYKKPLLYYNREPKSRMQSIINLCGIENNDGTKQFNGTIPRIDYEHVSKALKNFRTESENILINMLKHPTNLYNE